MEPTYDTKAEFHVLWPKATHHFQGKSLSGFCHCLVEQLERGLRGEEARHCRWLDFYHLCSLKAWIESPERHPSTSSHSMSHPTLLEPETTQELKTLATIISLTISMKIERNQ